MVRKKKGKRGKKSGGYRSPGVYVEEVSSGSRPIEAVVTSIAAFVGFAPLRPARAAVTLAVAVAGVVLVVRSARGLIP